MSPRKRPASSTDAPLPRTPAERVAVRRLEAALIEQTRVEEVYARAIGTSMEQSAYVRLQEASANVTECDREAKAQ